VQLQTILNSIQKQRSFIYDQVRLLREEGRPHRLEVDLRSRANGRPICSGCQRPGPGYDTLPLRRFEFVPLWGLLVFFCYAPRRVDCARCGVRVEALPWATGKHQLTTTYAWFLATWAKRLSWSEVARVFRTSWDTVFRAVELAVTWGRTHVDLSGITAIGVDEILWQRGHRYLTVVYQINDHAKRLLWVGLERKTRTLLEFFRWFGPERSQRLQFICSDLWHNYLRVIAKKAAGAIHVLDRFHIMSHFNKAIDLVRAQEAKALKAQGHEPVLKHTRWCLLKRPENLTEKQEVTLAQLLRLNLRTARSYLLREDFQGFWDYVSPAWARKFLERWCRRALRSRIEPMKKVARMLRRHAPLLLNWFRARRVIALGAVEGLNNKAKITMRKAYGFRSFRKAEVALYHTLGQLPEPEFAHRFC